MITRKVLTDGRIVLPKSVVQAFTFEASDTIHVRIVGPGHIDIRAMSSLTLEEVFERYPIEGPIDEAADREAWQDEAAKDVIGQ